jgi:mono/diheme cytochrome c family protein
MDYNRDDYNKGGLIAFVGTVAFCILFFIYISFVHPGIDLKEIPEGTAEGGAAQTLAAAPVDPDVSKIAKPWLENADMLAHGKFVFKNNCAICHGDQGMGDGPAGKALVPPPRNFVEGKWRYSGTSDGLWQTIANGSPGTSMASMKHLPKVDRWAVIQFVRSITKNKIKDDPAKLEAFAKTAE